MDIGAIIAIVVGVATIAAVIGSAFYWSGKLSSRVTAQGEQIAGLTAQVAAQGEQIAALAVQVAVQGEQIAALTERVGAVEGEVAKLVRQSERNTDRLDAISVRMDALTAEVASTRRELVAAVSHHVHHTDGSISFRAPLPETP